MAEHDYRAFPELTNNQIQEFGIESPHPQITEDFDATVIKVTDGDTVRLLVDFRDFDFPLRLLDIDAPEMNAGGEESKAWLKGLIEGTEVRILIDKNNRVGKYGRLLGKIMSLGMDVGSMAMALGYAVAFGQKDQSVPPDLNKLLRMNQWF